MCRLRLASRSRPPLAESGRHTEPTCARDDQGNNMSRKKEPDDQPDAVLMTTDGGTWEVFCALCPRTLSGVSSTVMYARHRACEHLEHSHGLVRVWVSAFRPGYREIVQVALPLIVEHDLTLATDPLGR